MAEVKVTRTVRVHEAPNRRFVRLTGDGTPENTRITDMHGNPIPEAVVSLEIDIGAGRCAKGTFKYVALGENGEPIPVYDPKTPDSADLMIREFEAWVIFEPPPRPPASPGYAELALELEAAREEIAVQAERIAAASFALGDGAARGASACDTRVPGPSAGELADIMNGPGNTAREPLKSEHVLAADGMPYESGLFEADPEGPPDPMAQRAKPVGTPGWAAQPTVRGEPFLGDHAEGTDLDREADDG